MVLGKIFFRSNPNQCNIKALNNLVDVQSAWSDILALDQEGKVYLLSTDGKMNSEQLNQIEPLNGIDNVVDISSYVHTYYVDNRQIIDIQWVFLKNDGTVWVNKDKFSSESFEQIKSLDNVIDTDQNHALKQDGTVWSWPNVIYNITDDALTATQINELTNIQSIRSYGNSNVAIDKNSSLWFWGNTITGYSDGTTRHYQATPVKLTSIKDVKEAFVVERSLIVLTNDGDVYITSIDREAMPANPSFELLISDVSQVQAGYRHMIMQKKDGSLWGWGVNKHGELGVGDFEFMYNTPQQMQRPVTVYFNDEPVVMNSGVIIKNGQAFIPLRSVFEKMGATINWEAYSKTVTISQAEADKEPVIIDINYTSGEVFMNQEPVTLTNRPFIVGGTAYLPVRFISESLGSDVEWVQNADEMSILITK